MEMNEVELMKLDDAATEGAELTSLRELADVQLLAIGGGCITANFC